uniref:Uncharacterized protein n=1 Tax=Candidatus Kentrum sp. SD TaxID=2126332 RepID=A0A451BIW2_9GAMM|nr:MAG: hypothetical protein BECKSD772D_GA0070982_100944 [Candidatus Kentron sp. SD]
MHWEACLTHTEDYRFHRKTDSSYSPHYLNAIRDFGIFANRVKSADTWKLLFAFWNHHLMWMRSRIRENAKPRFREESHFTWSLPENDVLRFQSPLEKFPLAFKSECVSFFLDFQPYHTPTLDCVVVFSGNSTENAWIIANSVSLHTRHPLTMRVSFARCPRSSEILFFQMHKHISEASPQTNNA